MYSDFVCVLIMFSLLLIVFIALHSYDERASLPRTSFLNFLGFLSNCAKLKGGIKGDVNFFNRIERFHVASLVRDEHPPRNRLVRRV